MKRLRGVVLGLGLAMVACEAGGDGVDGAAFATSPMPADPGPPAGAGTPGDDDEGESSSGPEGSDEDSDGSTGFRFDVPADDEDVQPNACETVDILFVIDNSGSMADEQFNLAASVPGFIAGIEDTLGAQTDYHVGVISTDEAEFNALGCQRMGALVTRTAGDLSSDQFCGPYVGGTSFMTPADTLDEAFSCAARLGIDGNGIERPMDALQAALHPESLVEGCNSGFLRDDALLVVVLITDEEDDIESEGGPASWYTSVVEAKGGDEERVVVLSLVGHPKPNDCIPTQWTGMQGAEIAERIIGFTGMFTHGFVGDICSDDYRPFFDDAVEWIDTACTVPVG